ncbi:MAG TPA: glycosyltransferase family 4 protein [Gammaproteobacteria bacterium]|nr:glycosyltransferase family 4 protein [Gammaproteobacteria bacterium]
MRILWVKVGGLWPTNTGGRLRSFNILSELAREHEVSVLTTHLPGEDGEALRRQLPQCKRVQSFPFAALKFRDPRFPLVLARSWFSSMPVDVYKHQVPELRRAVDELLVSGDIDLCIADFAVATPNVPMDGPVPVMFFSHNVEYQILKRLAEAQLDPIRRGLLTIEWRKMRRYEAEICRKARLTVAVSAHDRDLHLADAAGAVIRDVPTGVDVSYFKANGTPENPVELVFTGSMDWHPNEDAIRHFINEILPAIRREVPHARLTVVGRNPSGSLRRDAEQAGVEVTGTVDDVRPYIDGAAVYVVPLRIGGGTRLKVFEALSMGKAVVSTGVGVEGLPLAPGKHYLKADDPASFASAVVSLLRDPERRQALGDAGRQLTHERFAWPQVARVFGSHCEAARG